MTPDIWIALAGVVIISACLGWLTLHAVSKFMRRGDGKPGNHQK